MISLQIKKGHVCVVTGLNVTSLHGKWPASEIVQRVRFGDGQTSLLHRLQLQPLWLLLGLLLHTLLLQDLLDGDALKDLITVFIQILRPIRSNQSDQSSNPHKCSALAEHLVSTHYFSQQNHIFSSDHEDASRNISELFPHVDPLHCLVQNQVRWWRGGTSLSDQHLRI